jgi:acetyltransferase-like isoleucine patch superfamily enzyme
MEGYINNYIHSNSIISETSTILPGAIIHQNSKIGNIVSNKKHKLDETIIGNNVKIGSFCTIYNGVIIRDDTIIDDYVKIGYSTKIGSGSRILYGAKIYKNVKIGKNCIISGFCCNRCKIGDNSSVFGILVHRYPRPKWGIKEKSPVIGKEVIVGMGAVVVGGITIGDHSYIVAGAIVTKDVPENSIVKSKSPELIPYNEWEGRLKEEKNCTKE